MAGRPALYSAERHKAIVAAIRAGAYDWIAAEANGIDRETFRAWMRRGEGDQVEPFRTFSLDVKTARAQARTAAEIEVRRDQPFNWLRFGPGRERDDAPGWTESREVKHRGIFDVVHSTEWTQISTTIEKALDPFPEARLAVARALREIASSEPSEQLALTDGDPIEAEVNEGAHDAAGT